MKRKVKKFSAGGDYDSSDDAKNLLLAADREAVEYEGEKIAKPLREAAQAAKAEPMKMASFGEAFKEARGRGDKTFEYMGKKYTTETAKPKAAPKDETPKTETDRPRTLAQKQEAAAPKMQGAYRDAASNFKRGLKSMFGMKAGGKIKSASSRADGCAMRGKTRGKMV
jgi:hypothetical protein